MLPNYVFDGYCPKCGDPTRTLHIVYEVRDLARLREGLDRHIIPKPLKVVLDCRVCPFIHDLTPEEQQQFVERSPLLRKQTP